MSRRVADSAAPSGMDADRRAGALLGRAGPKLLGRGEGARSGMSETSSFTRDFPCIFHFTCILFFPFISMQAWIFRHVFPPFSWAFFPVAEQPPLLDHRTAELH